MTDTTKTYLKGLFVKRQENAPDFVVGAISIKREDLIAELQGMSEEWINLDIRKEKDGKGIYSKINTWKTSESRQVVSAVNSDSKVKIEDVPF